MKKLTKLFLCSSMLLVMLSGCKTIMAVIDELAASVNSQGQVDKALIGEWTASDNESVSVYTFNADGTYSYAQGKDMRKFVIPSQSYTVNTSKGNYRISGNVIYFSNTTTNHEAYAWISDGIRSTTPYETKTGTAEDYSKVVLISTHENGKQYIQFANSGAQVESSSVKYWKN